MRYHVHGQSRTTGKQTTLVINAKHHEAAHAIAQRELIVSQVVPEGGLTEPEVFDPRAFDEPAEPMIPMPANSSLLSRRPPRHSFLAILFIVCLFILLGVLALLLIRRHV